MWRFWPNHRQDVAHRAFQQPATSSSSVSFLGFMGVPRNCLQATQPFILLFFSAFYSHSTRNHLREKTKLWPGYRNGKSSLGKSTDKTDLELKFTGKLCFVSKLYFFKQLTVRYSVFWGDFLPDHIVISEHGSCNQAELQWHLARLRLTQGMLKWSCYIADRWWA